MRALMALTVALGASPVFGALAERPPLPVSTPTQTPALTAGKYTHGLLWKIESPRSAPSYLFGTIHTDDARVLALPAVVAQTLARAASFTTEMAFDADAMSTTVQTMFYTDGRTLADVIGPALYAETRQALLEHGQSSEGIERQKPWVAVLMLSMPRPGGLFLDMALQMQAVQQQKPVHGLETTAEQLAVFDDLALDDQIELLRHTLSVRQHFAAQFEELTRAWLARDLARLMALMDQDAPDARLAKLLIERLFTQRNERMARRMEPRLSDGNAFIAVGAGHLPGVLALLEARGHRVTPVY